MTSLAWSWVISSRIHPARDSSGFQAIRAAESERDKRTTVLRPSNFYRFRMLRHAAILSPAPSRYELKTNEIGLRSGHASVDNVRYHSMHFRSCYPEKLGFESLVRRTGRIESPLPFP
jgi:hypothetical protein